MPSALPCVLFSTWGLAGPLKLGGQVLGISCGTSLSKVQTGAWGLTSYFLFVCPESGVPAQVVAAIDVNTVANEVYKHNFPHTQLLARTIEVSMVVTGLIDI